MRSVKEDTRKASAQQSRRKSHSDVIWAIVFLAPALIAILTMRIVPGISAAYSSLFKALPGGLSVPKFDGLGNYVKLFSNPEFIAGLEDIPTEYYEAASIDRAGPFRTFFSVTVPLLKRQLLFVLVSDTVANFVLFVPIQMLTNGGPQNSSTVLMFDAYRTTFTFSSRNLGSAEVVILMIVMLAAVGIQFLLLREGDDR